MVGLQIVVMLRLNLLQHNFTTQILSHCDYDNTIVTSSYSLYKLLNLLSIPNKQQVLLRSLQTHSGTLIPIITDHPVTINKPRKTEKPFLKAMSRNRYAFASPFGSHAGKLPVPFHSYPRVKPTMPVHSHRTRKSRQKTPSTLPLLSE